MAAVGVIKKTLSVPTADIGVASVNLDLDVAFNNHVAALVRWASIGGVPSGTVQFAASMDGTNFILLGSATNLTAGAGSVLFEDQNFEGQTIRVVYTFGDETDETGTIDVDILGEKPR